MLFAFVLQYTVHKVLWTQAFYSIRGMIRFKQLRIKHSFKLNLFYMSIETRHSKKVHLINVLIHTVPVLYCTRTGTDNTLQVKACTLHSMLYMY